MVEIEKFILLLIIISSVGCSALQQRDYKFENTNMSNKFYNYYNNWDIESAREILLKLEDMGEKKYIIEYYEERLNYKETKKNDLEKFITDIIDYIKNSEIEKLKDNTAFSFKRFKILGELEKLNTDNFRFIVGKPKFEKQQANIILIINDLKYDQIYYFDANLILEKDQWLINDINERR